MGCLLPAGAACALGCLGGVLSNHSGLRG